MRGSDLWPDAPGSVDRANGLTFYEDGTVEGRSLTRAPVVEVQYLDGRQRKSALGRGLAGIATAGFSLIVANANAGWLNVIIVTPEWTHAVHSKGSLTKLYSLAVQAKVRYSEGRR
jgi:hypothetical protein